MDEQQLTQIIQKLLDQGLEKAIDRKLLDFHDKIMDEVDDYKRFRQFATVTDQYSPHTGASTKLGFFGTSAISKPTVTGSKAANAALTSLCTALANLGIITNSTS